VVILQRWPELNDLPTHELQRYVKRAGFRHLGNAYRGETRCGRLETDWARQQETCAPSSQELLERLESVLLCRELLAALPRRFFVVAVARELEGLSIRETSKKLKIPESAVKSRQRGARKLLKRLAARADLSRWNKKRSKRRRDRNA
jgi:DNA-directed RNA polymerase specialized sigma24 family protein